VKRPNAWHDAICTQLSAAKAPLTVWQIWSALASSGFQHRSKHPRQTLTARIAELVQMKKVGRVGSATYRLMGTKDHPELFPAGTATTETYTR
jgi:hypothetical protein